MTKKDAILSLISCPLTSGAIPGLAVHTHTYLIIWVIVLLKVGVC